MPSEPCLCVGLHRSSVLTNVLKDDGCLHFPSTMAGVVRRSLIVRRVMVSTEKRDGVVVSRNFHSSSVSSTLLAPYTEVFCGMTGDMGLANQSKKTFMIIS